MFSFCVIFSWNDILNGLYNNVTIVKANIILSIGAYIQ